MTPRCNTRKAPGQAYMPLIPSKRTILKVFTSSDTIGVEVAGAVKNVIAIAAGICEGLGLGTNSMAALVTRGCSEVGTARVIRSN